LSRYPRTCKGKRGPHTIEGPADEDRGVCRVCRLASRRAAQRRYAQTEHGREVEAARVQRRITSGRHAEAKARYTRRKDEERDNQLARELH